MKRRPHAEPPSPKLTLSDANDLVAKAFESHARGDIGAAEDVYNRVLAVFPDHADALNLAGAAAFSLGRVRQSIGLISKAMRLVPHNLDVRLNLAEALAADGQMARAVETCRQALEIKPDFIDGHARLATLHNKLGQHGVAFAHARIALAFEPRQLEALRARGVAEAATLRPNDAEASFRAALEVDAADVDSLFGLGVMLHFLDELDEAAETLRKVLEIDPRRRDALSALGRNAEARGDSEAALSAFDAAAKLGPPSPDADYEVARCLRDLGRFDEAKPLLEAVLVRAPNHGPSIYALARARSLPDSSESRRRLKGLAASEPHGPWRVQAGFALAEILNNASDYDGAFEAWGLANRTLRDLRASAGIQFHRRTLEIMADLNERQYAEDFANASEWGDPTEAPVFIVGMPRSGTTLVEQICASHSAVHGAGELQLVAGAWHRLSKLNAQSQTPADWDPGTARLEAQRLNDTMRRLGGEAERVVDKSPFNLLRLGLISALLPNARVIWCRRDPRDLVVSNHSTYFAEGNLSSTDLGDCAHEVLQMDRMGRLWSDALPVRILEVRYEDLVADLEGGSRRIIDFLGLGWEPGVLEYYKTRRTIDTPSGWQVRQPIYASSVGRWRLYEKHLQPMFDVLGVDAKALP
jgi:tetratricopeptide (TPR) repeat protein